MISLNEASQPFEIFVDQINQKHKAFNESADIIIYKGVVIFACFTQKRI